MQFLSLLSLKAVEEKSSMFPWIQKPFRHFQPFQASADALGKYPVQIKVVFQNFRTTFSCFAFDRSECLTLLCSTYTGIFTDKIIGPQSLVNTID